MKKLSKLKIISITLAITAVVIAAASGSIAFFTDVKESTGIFTAGNVYVELTEAAVKSDASGNLIEDTAAERFSGAEITEQGAAVVRNYGVVFPGQTIYKDPTVKNTGDHSAWIAVKVIVEDGSCDIHKLYKYSDGYDDIDIERFLRGGLLDEHVHVGDWNGIPDVCFNDNYAMIQSSSHAAGKYEFYFLMLKPFASGDEVEVFDTFYIDPMFGNVEMQEFKELKITVQAFAVQEYGFVDCLSAMSTAFPEHFVTCIAAP